MPAFPYRVRLFGGRSVHAVRDVNGGPDRATACELFLPAESRNTWLPDATPVQCTRCLRATTPKET